MATGVATAPPRPGMHSAAALIVPCRGAQTAWNAPRGSADLKPRSGNGIEAGAATRSFNAISIAAGAAIRSLKPEKSGRRPNPDGALRYQRLRFGHESV